MTTRNLFAAFTVAAASLTATQALATASGVRINNTVTIQYDVGGVAQPDQTAEAGFVVDRKIDMLVADQGSVADGLPGQTDRQLVFRITNEGNDTQDFDVDVALTGSLGSGPTLDTNSDTLGAGEYRVYTSMDPTLDAGDIVYDPTGYSVAASPGAGAEFYLIVVTNIPDDAVNGESVSYSVAVTALDATGTAPLTESLGNGLDDAVTPANAVDIVFADGAKTAGSAGTDGVEDGVQTDNGSITISSAELTATKAVTIVSENTDGAFDCTVDADPAIDDNTQGAIPGGCLEYTITVTNGAAASENADNVSISDPLPAGVTFSAFMDTTGWNNEAHAAGVITADVAASMAPGDSASIVFRVTVD